MLRSVDALDDGGRGSVAVAIGFSSAGEILGARKKNTIQQLLERRRDHQAADAARRGLADPGPQWTMVDEGDDLRPPQWQVAVVGNAEPEDLPEPAYWIGTRHQVMPVWRVPELEQFGLWTRRLARVPGGVLRRAEPRIREAS